jgi:2-dehydropantoate 2-reductase
MNPDTKVLIWGAGAIGGAVGAYLHRVGREVLTVDTDADHVAAIRRDGLRINGPVEQFVARVPVALPGEVAGRWDCVLLAVKAQFTEAACRELLPRLTADGVVVSLQNGFCVDAVASILGAERTLGAFVNFAGDRLEPGHVRFGARGTFAVGELDGRLTPRAEAIVTLLRDFEPEVETATDLRSRLWGKMCFTLFLASQALGEAGTSDCLERLELLPLWCALGGEIVALARAEGTVPKAFDGLEPIAFAPGVGEEYARHAVLGIATFNRRGAKTHSGYWRDIAIRKRKSEVEALITPVLDIGRRLGVACPAISALLTMILEVEAGRRVQSDANLPELLSKVNVTKRGASSP